MACQSSWTSNVPIFCAITKLSKWVLDCLTAHKGIDVCKALKRQSNVRVLHGPVWDPQDPTCPSACLLRQEDHRKLISESCESSTFTTGFIRCPYGSQIVEQSGEPRQQFVHVHTGFPDFGYGACMWPQNSQPRAIRGPCRLKNIQILCGPAQHFVRVRTGRQDFGP